jgi:arsenate reductase (glutaredoxin)
MMPGAVANIDFVPNIDFVEARAYGGREISQMGNAMPVRIYHNPRCNTSRKTLALLRDKGVEPEIVEYLKTPYTAAQLKMLLGQMKMQAKALIRKKEAAEAGIDPARLSEDQLIAAMVRHPIIVERPIVVSGSKAALGRPPEKVLEVL